MGFVWRMVSMEKGKKVTSWTCRILVGGFFMLAGVIKALDPGAFQLEIMAYQLVGYPISFLLSYLLPYFEIALGAGLILGIGIKIAQTSISFLLIGFISVLSWTWMMGINIECGCLGKIDFMEGQPAAILRDFVLLAMVLCVAYFGSPRKRC